MSETARAPTTSEERAVKELVDAVTHNFQLNPHCNCGACDTIRESLAALAKCPPPTQGAEEARKVLIQRLMRITYDTVLIGNAHIVEVGFSDALSVYEATLRAALSRGTGWSREQQIHADSARRVVAGALESADRHKLNRLEFSVETVRFFAEVLALVPAPPSPLAQENADG